MKTILAKFIESDYEMNLVDFGKILSERKCLCIIFPDNLETSYQLFSYFAGWKDLFEKFYFCFSENLLPFFTHLSFTENTEYVLHHNFVPCEQALLFNFMTEGHIQEDISCCQQTIIIDMKQEFNVKIAPAPKDEMQLLEKFATLFSFPLKKETVELKPIIDKSSFFNNTGLHIVIDVNETKYAKYYESVIRMIKNECEANFYITGIPFEQDAFIHVINMKTDDIFQLYTIACNADLFISDDYSLLIVLKKYLKNALFWGKEDTFSDLPSLHPKNIFELKNLILEMNNRKTIM